MRRTWSLNGYIHGCLHIPPEALNLARLDVARAQAALSAGEWAAPHEFRITNGK